MRNKIKQLLKKEGGFTLIELLAVIAILALIVAISIPLIGNVVADSKAKTEDAQKELVIDAAKMYELDTPIGEAGVTTTVLEEKGFLEANPKVNYTITKKTGADKKTTYTATKQ